MKALVLLWQSLGWQSALLFLGAIVLLGTLTLLALCVYFSEEERELRALRRRNRRSRKDLYIPRARLDVAHRTGQFSVGHDAKDKYL